MVDWPDHQASVESTVETDGIQFVIFTRYQHW